MYGHLVKGAIFMALMTLIGTQINAEIPYESLHVFQETKDLYDKAAKDLLEVIRENPQAVIVLPTGTTPQKMYDRIVERFKQQHSIDFSRVRFFNLDEYLGLGENHPLSYKYYMDKLFYGPLRAADLKRAPQDENIHIPGLKDGESPEDALKRYGAELQSAINANPSKKIDLVILGLGGAYPVKKSDGSTILKGGHIAFNEPGSKPDSQMHVVQLTEKTRKDTKFRFTSLKRMYQQGLINDIGNIEISEEVPTHALSMGMKEILSADKIIVLATGENKAPVIQQIFGRGVNKDFPGSYLLGHSNTMWLIDDDAASLINYYPWQAEGQKPSKDWYYQAVYEAVMLRNQKPEFIAPDQFSKTGLKITPQALNVHFKELKNTLRSKYGVNTLPQGQRILLVSPHPDDDVIGMGATIGKLVERGNRVHVVYVVHGANSVPDSSSIYQKHLKVINDQNPKLLEEEKVIGAKARARQEEAIMATRHYGLKAANLHFFNADFYYRRGIPGVHAITAKDINRMVALLLKLKPQKIFFAAENDPHGAHGLASELVARALESSELRDLRNKQKINYYGYRGAYNEWTLYHPDSLIVVPFTQAEMDKKISAIKAHDSQLTAMYPSFDPDPFYERAYKRNKKSMEILKKLEIVDASDKHEYAEIFFQFGDEFIERYKG